MLCLFMQVTILQKMRQNVLQLQLVLGIYLNEYNIYLFLIEQYLPKHVCFAIIPAAPTSSNYIIILITISQAHQRFGKKYLS